MFYKVITVMCGLICFNKSKFKKIKANNIWMDDNLRYVSTKTGIKNGFKFNF